jgi:hypothetical protein
MTENLAIKRLESELTSIVRQYANEPRKPVRDRMDSRVKQIKLELEKIKNKSNR